MTPEEQERQWQERCARLAKLIELNAPRLIIGDAAKLVMMTAFGGKWWAIRRWILFDVEVKRGYLWNRLQIFYLQKMFHLDRETATDIVFGIYVRPKKKEEKVDE